MYQFKLYNCKEIEKLNQDLEIYKKALEAKDTEDFTKHTEMKQESELLLKKVLKYKGEMKAMEETYQSKINSYELNDRKLASQIQAVNYSIEQLKHDIQTIKGEVKELRAHELLEKIDQVLGKTDIGLNDVKKQINEQQTEFTEIKTQLQSQNNNRRPANNGRSEYRQLHQLLKSAKPKEHKAPPSTTPLITASQSPTISKNAKMVTKPTNKKTFHNTRYEFNKNIITKKTTSKTKKQNMESKNKPAAEDSPITSISDTEPTTAPSVQEKVEKETEPVTQEKPVIPEIRPNEKLAENNAEIEQKSSSSPGGLKKTWQLAKSLWKK